MQKKENLAISLTKQLLQLNVPKGQEPDNIKNYGFATAHGVLNKLKEYRLLDLAIISKIEAKYFNDNYNYNPTPNQKLILLNQFSKINSYLSSLTKDESYKTEIGDSVGLIAKTDDIHCADGMIERLNTVIFGLESINSGNIAKSIQDWKQNTINYHTSLYIYKQSTCSLFDVHYHTKLLSAIGEKYGLNIDSRQNHVKFRTNIQPEIEQEVKKEFSEPNAVFLLINQITENITKELKIADKKPPAELEGKTPWHIFKQYFPFTNDANKQNIYSPDDEDDFKFTINKDYVQEQVIQYFIERDYLINNLGQTCNLQNVKDYMDTEQQRKPGDREIKMLKTLTVREIDALTEDQAQYRHGTDRYRYISNAIGDLKDLKKLINNDNKQIEDISNNFKAINDQIKKIACSYQDINGSAFFSKTFIKMLKHVYELIKGLFTEIQNEPQRRKDTFVKCLKLQETKLQQITYCQH